MVAALLAGLVDDGTNVAAGAGVLGILVGLVILLVRQYSAQQAVWQTLSDRAWEQAREAQAEVDRKQAELDRQADRARQCEGDLDAARRACGDAQILATAKEAEVNMLNLQVTECNRQLDELRRQLAEARQPREGG